jgi:hypothetical protein
VFARVGAACGHGQMSYLSSLCGRIRVLSSKGAIATNPSATRRVETTPFSHYCNAELRRPRSYAFACVARKDGSQMRSGPE